MNIAWSTAKSWIQKDENMKKNKSNYASQLKLMGKRKKLGVGRKISY